MGRKHQQTRSDEGVDLLVDEDMDLEEESNGSPGSMLNRAETLLYESPSWTSGDLGSFVEYYEELVRDQPDKFRFDVYRDAPRTDAKGNVITGLARKCPYVIDESELSDRLGPGTYHVQLMGPKKATGRGCVFRDRVSGIQIAPEGRISPEGELSVVDSGDGSNGQSGRVQFVDRQQLVEAEEQGAASVAKRESVETMNKLLELQEKSADAAERRENELRSTIKELGDRSTNAQLELMREQLSERQGDTSGVKEILSHVTATLTDTIKSQPKERSEEAQRLSQLVTDLRAENSELRRLHAETATEMRGNHLKELSDLRDVHRDDVDRVKGDARDRIRDTETRYQDRLKDMETRHDDRLKDMERRNEDQVKTLTTNYETRLQNLEDRKKDLESRIEDMRGDKEKLRDEISELRSSSVRAELTAKIEAIESKNEMQSLQGVATTVGVLKDVAGNIGLLPGKVEEGPKTITDRIFGVADKVVERVADSDTFARAANMFMSNVENRQGAGTSGPPMAGQVQAWQVAQAEMNAQRAGAYAPYPYPPPDGGAPTVEQQPPMPDAPAPDQPMPDGVPFEQPGGQPPPQTNEDLFLLQAIDMVEASSMTGRPVAEAAAEFLGMIGVSASQAQLLLDATPNDAVLEMFGLGDQLTIGGRQYLFEALDLVRAGGVS